jgi:hypothetical protein
MTLRLAVLVLLAAAGLSAADPAYLGKWKLNVAKSDFGQMTVTYEAVPGGGYKTTMDGLSYTFKTDGTETPTPWGSTAAWKSIDANTWEVTQKANGKVMSTDTMKLAPDGKTLMLDSKMTKATGEAAVMNMTFQRVSGGPGLAGTWKAAKMSSTSPAVIEIAAKGADGLVLKFVDQGGVCDAKFDGKDHPATGTLWPAGWTCVVAKGGDQAFNVTWKKDGKPMYQSTFSASTDGKTLTETGGASNTSEKIRAVYDKQ